MENEVLSDVSKEDSLTEGQTLPDTAIGISLVYDVATNRFTFGMSRPVDPVTLYGILQSAMFEAFKMNENIRARMAQGITPGGIVLPGQKAPHAANIRL